MCTWGRTGIRISDKLKGVHLSTAEIFEVNLPSCRFDVLLEIFFFMLSNVRARNPLDRWVTHTPAAEIFSVSILNMPNVSSWRKSKRRCAPCDGSYESFWVLPASSPKLQFWSYTLLCLSCIEEIHYCKAKILKILVVELARDGSRTKKPTLLSSKILILLLIY